MASESRVSHLLGALLGDEQVGARGGQLVLDGVLLAREGLLELARHGAPPVRAGEHQRRQVELLVARQGQRLPEAPRLLREHAHAPVGLHQAAVGLEGRGHLLLVPVELADNLGR